MKDPDEWESFLRTSARLYRYPFTDQLMIYAQRPDASACASFDDWSVKLHCGINRGAKGIALLNDGWGNRLRYVFDISDVNDGFGKGRKPKLWKLGERSMDAVLKGLK